MRVVAVVRPPVTSDQSPPALFVLAALVDCRDYAIIRGSIQRRTLLPVARRAASYLAAPFTTMVPRMYG